ncbi:FMN-linked oxidoreductase [Guyanagaster necrorhizus]|uniref:FMN-linked oxidoreductase n=1 Tax=Guyanagaster necrorhizus TaxID=856835 RepID=A0A9P7VRL6_9AGAR|nr:FMN-linked oxidoreductase [Guyanagaster necrorhizus MCA 3950]KAG7445332.1 FMN-linked oxidoreductase [Guyanagaster necrorhizus MCA 3950]
MPNLQALFQPLKVDPITLKNRIFMSALTRNRSVPTNVLNDLNAEYYRQRIAGGAGLINTEGVLIVQQGYNAPGLWAQEQVKGWKKVTDAVHEEGIGRASHPDAPEQIASGQPVYAPSAISARGGKFHFLSGSPGYVTPTTIDDPRTLLAQWKQAAVNAKEAGFDGVEIHGANGYLWGGSIQNRARFALEVVKAAVETWGADRVGIKLNPAGGDNDVGMPLQETVDTFSYLISELDKLGIAYVALVRYAERLDPVIDGARRGTKHDILSTYAPLVKNPATRVFVNSGFTGEEAARYVEDGKVDGVFFGISWVANPDFARRVETGVALERNIDFASLFGHGGVEADERKGYADYPAATFQMSLLR